MFIHYLRKETYKNKFDFKLNDFGGGNTVLFPKWSCF